MILGQRLFAFRDVRLFKLVRLATRPLHLDSDRVLELFGQSGLIFGGEELGMDHPTQYLGSSRPDLDRQTD